MNRDIVREKIEDVYKEFKKSKTSLNTTDDYTDYHIYYDKDDRFVAIELFDFDSIIIDGVKLTHNFNKSALNTIANDFNESDNCYISISKSICIYVEDEEILSILVAKEGYYK